MMRAIGLISLFFVGTVAAAPDLSEDRTLEIASKLAPEGLSGRLAEAIRTEWGRKALQERLDLVMAGPVARVRHDAPGLYEDHLFAPDDLGRLVLRPERRAEIEKLRARKALALARFDAYSKRLDEIGARILEESELDKAAKAGWEDRDWRICLFNSYVNGGLVDSDHDVEQVLDTRLMVWLLTGNDRKLHVSEPGAVPVLNLMRDVYGFMDEVKKYEGAVAKLLGKADEAVVTIAAAKLAADAKKEGADGLARLIGLDPKELLNDIEPTLRTVARLKSTLDAVVLSLANDDTRSNDLKMFLQDARTRALLVQRLTPTGEAQAARVDRFFATVMPAAWCDAKDDKLVFKRHLFRDWRGQDNVEGFRAHTYDLWKFQLKGLQQPFVSTAERCVDPAIAELFRDADLLVLLRQEAQRIAEARMVAVNDRAADTFLRVYFTEKEGRYVVRPDREKQVESLLARAEQLKPKN